MGTIETIASGVTASSRRNGTRDGLLRLIREIFRTLAVWSEQRRSRAALRELTDDQLRDIGLTRREVHREVAKSFFWD